MGKFYKDNRKQLKKYITLGIGTAVVLFLAVMPMLAASRDTQEENKASILTVNAVNMDIEHQLIGGGQLSSEAAVQIKIPEHVKLTQMLVGNGDVVSKGDAIAKVDRISVMSAIMEVQNTLDHLAEEITDEVNDTESDSVRAQAGGIVKIIYGQNGESAEDVMLRDGCLAVLSLDGLMAVKIERNTELYIGEKVSVVLPDDTEVEGRVASNQDGVLVVTIEDNKYEIGTKVTVKTADDDCIGSGNLYIYSQWNATAYSGTIYDIQVRENEKVAAGRVMFLLRNSGNTAQFQRLVDQRQDYEELMKELFAMYQSQTISAPCNGIVSGVEEDGAYLLEQEEQGWIAQLLSFIGNEKKTGFTAFPVQVEAVTEKGMTLKIAPSAMEVDEISKLSAMAVKQSEMTETWNYVGDTTVYTQDSAGLMHASGNAKVGDILLMVGDDTRISWFVVPDEDAAEKECPRQQEKTHAASLVSSEEDSFAYSRLWGPSDWSGGEDWTDWSIGESWPDWSGEGYWPDWSGDSDEPDGEGGAIGGDGGTAAIVYLGYVAQVTEISEGTLKVMQTPYAYTFSDMENLPAVSVDVNALTKEATYTSTLITTDAAAVEDYILLILNTDGNLTGLKKLEASSEGLAGGKPGAGQDTAGMPSGGTMPDGMEGMGDGMLQEEPFELYTLEKQNVASVTSQDHMTVSITVDELEISRVYVGQNAVVSVDALGGELFDASVTKISNQGVNEGGNSKFTVELTLARSGEMLPGMYSSAVITLEKYPGVLCIPVAALEKVGKNSIVYTSYNKETGTLGDPVVVTLGISDDENVQILTGLTQDQTVYYAYYDTYTGSGEPDVPDFFQHMNRRR